MSDWNALLCEREFGRYIRDAFGLGLSITRLPKTGFADEFEVRCDCHPGQGGEYRGTEPWRARVALSGHYLAATNPVTEAVRALTLAIQEAVADHNLKYGAQPGASRPLFEP